MVGTNTPPKVWYTFSWIGFSAINCISVHIESEIHTDKIIWLGCLRLRLKLMGHEFPAPAADLSSHYGCICHSIIDLWFLLLNVVGEIIPALFGVACVRGKNNFYALARRAYENNVSLIREFYACETLMSVRYWSHMRETHVLVKYWSYTSGTWNTFSGIE